MYISEKYSKSQIKANHKYNKKAYKRVSLYFKNREMTVIENFCKDRNYSKNNLFIESVKEKIERETNKNFDELFKKLLPVEENETAKSAKTSGAEKDKE